MSLSDEHLREIGRITTNFAAVEFVLRWMVWRLLGVDSDVMGISTLRDNFAGLAEKFRPLVVARVQDPGDRDEALAWLKLAHDANRGRTAAVHGSWSPSTEPSEAMLLRLQKGAWFGALLTVDELRRHADAIAQVGRRGAELAMRLGLFSPPDS